MEWSAGIWILIGVGVLVALTGLQTIYLWAVLVWSDQRTTGLRYFGRPIAERERFKRTLRRHARFLRPILYVSSRVSPFKFENASFRHRGITAPKGTCSQASFDRAVAYRPRAEDVFVVTQMRSGTTWMQHLVYQVLVRGNGDLAESGKALSAVSPWLEGRKTVPVDQAALVGGDRPSRVIKTHLPVSHCPFDPDARYVYVVRHPVSCFASCVDFVSENSGAFAPSLETVERWFCSEHMWWGSWPAHVEGWWRRSRQADNVLFIRFEQMKGDLSQVARDVSHFLGMRPASDHELEATLAKCRFDYMRQHSEAFEMHPPHILATDARLFVRGAPDRHTDVPEEVGNRIRAWCAAELQNASYPVGREYPDMTVELPLPRRRMSASPPERS